MAEPLKNEFSWSISRDTVFRTCLRRYWYEYYASWGGWDEGAPPLAREIYVLKKLKTRQMWVGDLVHRAVERSLTNLARGLPVLDVGRIVEITLNLMRNEFRASRRGNYRHAKGGGLFEHAYGIAVSDGEWKAAAEAVERCLRHFYASELFAGLSRLDRSSLLEVENLSSFTFEGTRCWVVLDAAWRAGEGITIADWKTGQTEPGGHELQLTGYALYAAEHWSAKPGTLTLLEYNLFHDVIHRHRADAATARRTASYIRGSIADMRSLLADQGANTPLPEERFVRTDKAEICALCKYRMVCRPAADAACAPRND